ncbi:MAG: right-handed parallel beta-helix repeat-containing protein, partial [Thermoplasmata archaeon]
MQKLFSIFVFLFLVLSLGSDVLESTPFFLLSTERFLPHAPIYIEGDGNFTFENGVVGGNGSPENPYLISGWEIDATGHKYGIHIQNTTSSWTIIDCRIHGANDTNIAVNPLLPLFIGNKNSTISIVNCTIFNSRNGIYLSADSKIKIIKNVIYNNTEWGIEFGVGSSIINGVSKEEIVLSVKIDGNEIYSNGGGMCGVSHAVVTNNTLYHNLRNGIVCSEFVVLLNNNISSNGGTGIYMVGHGAFKFNTVIKGNIIFSNGINGIECLSGYFSPQIEDNVVSKNEECGIKMIDGSVTMEWTIRNNYIFNNSRGLYIYFPSQSSFKKDREVTSTWSKRIYNNEISNNSVGIFFKGASGHLLCGNKLGSNRWVGIECDATSGKNVFALNVLINNSSPQCIDRSLNKNIWNLTSEGNYWSDWQSPDNNYDGI